MITFIISIFEYGWCYFHTCRQILLPWQMLMPMILWQMLLPYQMLLPIFPCIIYLWQMLLPKDYVFILLFSIGRWYCLIFVVDVETTFGGCYLPGGRWNSHMLQQMAGVEQSKIKSKCSANEKRRETTQTGQNNTNPKPYMVVPYYRGLSMSLKKVCSRHGVQVYFKGGNTIKIPQWPQKIKIQSWRRVGSSIDINVIGWTVMRNTLENPQGCLERGSRNIRRHLPPYLTTPTSLVITSL